MHVIDCIIIIIYLLYNKYIKTANIHVNVRAWRNEEITDKNSDSVQCAVFNATDKSLFFFFQSSFGMKGRNIDVRAKQTVYRGYRK